MARDFYASPFGVAYAAYMERPKVVRWVARTVWAGDTRPYFESMRAIAEVPEGGTIVDCPVARARRCGRSSAIATSATSAPTSRRRCCAGSASGP